MISFCQLLEIPTQGQKFTWSGVRKGEMVKERLDRALANIDWLDRFPKAATICLPANGSDHSFVVCYTELKDKWGKRLFKFKAIWVDDQECGKIIKESWNESVQGSYFFQLVKKLKNCRKRIVDWCKEKKKQKNQKAELVATIGDLQDKCKSVDDRTQIKILQGHLHEIWDREEVFWHQRARVNWLECGDKNTRFFYQTTKMRR